MYGTAWKEDATERCVRRGARRRVSRASTPRTSASTTSRKASAAAIARCRQSPRDELFLQTKFTFRRRAGSPAAVRRATRRSRRRSRSRSRSRSSTSASTRSTAYVLHGPSQRDGLGRDDREAWRAMEALARGWRARSASATSRAAQLERAASRSRSVKPEFVQNRCYARTGWDRDVRALCCASTASSIRASRC